MTTELKTTNDFSRVGERAAKIANQQGYDIETLRDNGEYELVNDFMSQARQELGWQPPEE